ncbi:MAG: permease, partial [Gemmatimonadetes bacterium]
MSDLRYALRSLARTPGFTAVAVLVISLGVGTTTASFSIANWLLLRPVPGVHDDGRLATVWFGHWSDGGGVSPSFLSYPNYADVMRRVTALSGLAGYQVASAAVGGAGAAA